MNGRLFAVTDIPISVTQSTEIPKGNHNLKI